MAHIQIFLIHFFEWVSFMYVGVKHEAPNLATSTDVGFLTEFLVFQFLSIFLFCPDISLQLGASFLQLAADQLVDLPVFVLTIFRAVLPTFASTAAVALSGVDFTEPALELSPHSPVLGHQEDK